MTFHVPAYDALSCVYFRWRRDLWSTSWFPLSVIFDHTTGALCSISSWDIPPRTYVGRTLYHTCSIVHAPLRFMIFRLKATVMFGDAILAFDTRSISYSERPISLRVNLSFQSWNWNFMIHLTSDQVSKFAASIGFLFLLDRPNFSLCFDRDMYRTSLDSN